MLGKRIRNLAGTNQAGPVCQSWRPRFRWHLWPQFDHQPELSVVNLGKHMALARMTPAPTILIYWTPSQMTNHARCVWRRSVTW